MLDNIMLIRILKKSVRFKLYLLWPIKANKLVCAFYENFSFSFPFSLSICRLLSLHAVNACEKKRCIFYGYAHYAKANIETAALSHNVYPQPVLILRIRHVATHTHTQSLTHTHTLRHCEIFKFMQKVRNDSICLYSILYFYFNINSARCCLASFTTHTFPSPPPFCILYLSLYHAMQIVWRWVKHFFCIFLPLAFC